MTREEQLELALWAVLSLIEDGGVVSPNGRPISRGLVPVDQAWVVLGAGARARIEREVPDAEL